MIPQGPISACHLLLLVIQSNTNLGSAVRNIADAVKVPDQLTLNCGNYPWWA